MALNYTSGNVGHAVIDGAGSEQVNSFLWLRKSIIEARKEQYFLPLADVKNMPKHMGKTIKVYEYLPLLDDRNVNDQGLDAAGAAITPGSGNLYGSSRDIGTIQGKLPTLTENGGRVNRVGFTRILIEGSLEEFGVFTEFTADSLNFDSDEQLREHLSRELMTGAVQVTEAQVQMDLLANAGVTLFAGAAGADDEVIGEGATPSVVDYDTFSRMDQILTENRTPRQTTIITGSRFVDTRVVPACRVMYIGSELVPLVKRLRDPFNNKAFIEVQHYADAGNTLNGEIGSIDQFRIVQVPEMLHWAAAGDEATAANPGYRTANNADSEERYNIYPMLVVGDESFTAIGFQTDGKKININAMTRMPGKEAMSHDDPYGKKGISSLSWYYGILVTRPQRIGLIKTVAPL